MDVANGGKWKKSKVDSFIRRHLSIFDLGMTRYYEMCMWDNKGTLLPSYAILMDKSIVLTENPPKTIIYTIPLSTIQDISLIADRHSLIKGKNNNAYICQHILIVYESLKSKRSKGSDTTKSTKDQVPNINDDHSNVNVVLPNSTISLSEEDEQKSDSSQTDLSVTHSNYSDVSVSPVPSFLEESFKSSLILSAYEPTMKLDNGDGYAWLRALDNDTDARRSASNNNNIPFGLGQSRTTRNSPFVISPILNDSLTPKISAYSLRDEELYHSTAFPTKWESMYAMKRQQRDLANHPQGSRENLLNNRRRRINDKSSRKKTTSSSTLNDTEMYKVTKRNKENEDKPVSSKQGTLENLHLYFYQRDSEFLNELSLVWNRQQLRNTEIPKDVLMPSNKTVAINKSLRAAEKVVSRVAQDWSYFERRDNDYRNGDMVSRDLRYDYQALLRKVIFLHKCLMRYEQLKYLCWKNPDIISGLINAITVCLEPATFNNNESFKDVYFDKLAIYAILMDIFRSLFEACNVSWFKETEYITQNNENYQNENFDEWEADMWDFKLSILDITRKLLSSILKSPFLPCSHDNAPGSFLAVTDSQRNSKAPWLMLGDEQAAKMAKLICTAHNASAALLFELLAISHFLPTLMEKTLVTSGIRQTNLERFIRLSVTQIINILWSSRDPMTASEAMILYRQAWNLRNLARHDRRTLEYMRNNFFEEFHYYVRSNGIKTRIPDQYAIKPKVIDACEKLSEDIVGKHHLKS